MALPYLASGDSMMSISYAFRIAHNIVSKIFSETCDVIWNSLKDEIFLQPSTVNWLNHRRKFRKYLPVQQLHWGS